MFTLFLVGLFLLGFTAGYGVALTVVYLSYPHESDEDYAEKEEND